MEASQQISSPVQKRSAADDGNSSRAKKPKSAHQKVINFLNNNKNCCIFAISYSSYTFQEYLGESIDELLSSSNKTEFYTPRLFGRKAIYLNKSNTKWIEIGVLPGEEFTPVAYFCGKGCQIRIPCSLDIFLEKIGVLSGVSTAGSAKTVLIKANTSCWDDLTISKANFGNGMYSLFNSSDPDRATFTTIATLSYLRTIGRSLKKLYDCLNAAEVKANFNKIVMAASHVPEWVETNNFEVLEDELLQNPPIDVNAEMLYEILTNFRSFFLRQLHAQSKIAVE